MTKFILDSCFLKLACGKVPHSLNSHEISLSPPLSRFVRQACHTYRLERDRSPHTPRGEGQILSRFETAGKDIFSNSICYVGESEEERRRERG